MYRESFLRQLIVGLFITIVFVSCDKDFNEIGTNIIGDDHYGFDKYSDASIKAYNQKLGPIASNNLEINPLGIYYNPAFGITTASFVTQLEMTSPNPTFTTIDNAPVIDSVIMSIPYNSTLGEPDVAGNKVYTLNSVYGEAIAKIKLGIYESGFYLRDLDPSEQFGTTQVFYTDKNAEIESHKIGQKINNSLDSRENDQFFFSNAEVKEKTLDTNGDAKLTKTAPAMRMHLDNAFFTAKILNAPNGKLFNNNIFKDYLRGLYFKVENTGSSPGNMTILDFKKGKITIYYKQDNQVAATETVPTFVERQAKTFVLNMTGNTVSLLENSDEKPEYVNAINNPNSTSGDETLYLKGGEGSISIIDLFGGTDPTKDLYGFVLYKNAQGKPIDENNNIIPVDNNGNPQKGYYLIYTKTNIANGVSDELDDLRYPNLNNDLSSTFYSKKNRWLINEANLTFYIEKTKLLDTKTIEPLRIYLYDLNNNRPLIDYFFDSTSNSNDPKKNKSVYGGIIEKENVTDGRGEKYKIKLTNHLRNLIMKDSTNVRLGLSVTDNINNVSMAKLKTSNSATDKAPKMSVLSPLGTILKGTNTNDTNKLKLEIYYTKPD